MLRHPCPVCVCVSVYVCLCVNVFVYLCVCMTVLSQESMASVSCAVTSGPDPAAHSPRPVLRWGAWAAVWAPAVGPTDGAHPSQTRPESAPTRSLLYLDSYSLNSESRGGRRPPCVSSLSSRVNFLIRNVAVGSAIAPAGRDAWGRSSRSGTPNCFWGCGSRPVEPSLPEASRPPLPSLEGWGTPSWELLDPRFF